MNLNLFDESIELITFDQASTEARVSLATIRNWIKTGYIVSPVRGKIDKSSWDVFNSEIIGKEKLNLRANKSRKNNLPMSHDKLDITSLINGDISTLGDIYESSLSESHRNNEGIYYTPSMIVQDMMRDMQIQGEESFLDPCCGSGNFIVEAIQKGIRPENIYGYDTDPNAVAITKMRIKDLTGYDTNQIECLDFLAHVGLTRQLNKRFDFIYTNPPWGKKMTNSQKQLYKKHFNLSAIPDTSTLFYYVSISILKEGGYLGFLVQDALFNITTFQEFRNIILKSKIKRLIDYDRAFKGVLTKAKAFVLQNDEVESTHEVSCMTKQHNIQRNQIDFTRNPKYIINFQLESGEQEVIDHLFQTKHITLKNNTEWALGIVTGNNKRLLSASQEKNMVPIYKGSDIECDRLKPPSFYFLPDLSLYQQAAQRKFYLAKEKLIYRFISNRLVFYYDDHQSYILNSANLLLTRDQFPISMKQLSQLLNSEIMNWLFRNIFQTHKVLRSDLELLPIHIQYFDKHSEFDENSFLKFLNIQKLNNGTYQIAK